MQQLHLTGGTNTWVCQKLGPMHPTSKLDAVETVQSAHHAQLKCVPFTATHRPSHSISVHRPGSTYNAHLRVRRKLIQWDSSSRAVLRCHRQCLAHSRVPRVLVGLQAWDVCGLWVEDPVGILHAESSGSNMQHQAV